MPTKPHDPNAGDARWWRGFPLPADTARIHLYVLVLLAATLLMYGVGLLRARDWVEPNGRLVGRDFLAFYMAGDLVRGDACTALYDFNAQQSWQARFMAQRSPRWQGVCLYLNPPHFAALMAPLTGWGYGPALAFWIGISLTCCGATLLIFRAWLPPEQFRTAAILTIGLPAWFQALAGGQNSCISLLILTGFCALLLGGRDLLAGLVLALLAFKFQLMLVPAGLLLWKRRWRACAGLALGVAATLLATGWGLGWPVLGDYATFAGRLSGLLEVDGFDVYKQHSWHGFFTLAGGEWLPRSSQRILTLTATLITGGVLLCIWRGPWRRERLPFILSATLVANLLISPHVFHYDLLLILPPAVLWTMAALREPCLGMGAAIRPFLGLGFLWLAVSPAMAETLRVQLSPWLMLAWLVVALRIARVYATQANPSAPGATHGPSALPLETA
jgi:alpha-1,2-mannosyltransferase